ncbi:MAG TPA: hypothetical protein VKR82_01015 [Candidatus Acidoferrales bacterium]|nr:hypothetical protein [Candidatus Acidoferrales bacterium]
MPRFDSSDRRDLIYISPTKDDRDQPDLCVAKIDDGIGFDFSYSDGAHFLVDREGREIWADWPQDYTLEDAVTYLLGPVIGFVLRLRGIVPLHASAVSIGEQVVALMGGPGAGKSTTAAGFARLGHAVLADDLAALRERDDSFLVQSGYPRVNVWPDSALALFGSEKPLPNISSTWDKRFVALDQQGMRFERREMPLAAIYILGPREESLRAPVIAEMEGSSALVNLAANTYVNYLLDQEMREHEFGVLSRVLSKVPVRFVRPPTDPACLQGLCEAIEIDAKKLTHLSSVSTHPGRA